MLPGAVELRAYDALVLRSSGASAIYLSLVAVVAAIAVQLM